MEIKTDASQLYNEPKKCVRTAGNMVNWYHSKAYYEALGFINVISSTVQGKRISDEIHISETMGKLISIFDKLEALVDATPPVEQPSRFGNPAFRSWSVKMKHDIYVALQRALPEEKCQYINELGVYFSESFGNSTRIDYGTGHEFSFIFFLCALFNAEILTDEDRVACALRLFNKYLTFVRQLQTTYRLEPAGSQGVWALDDYQFLPFIWGSAQLALNTPFDPSKFLDDDIIEKYKDDYMFIGCIDFIRKVKTGHFAEHSNQLWSISAVPSWSKINSGLVKMYKTEFLSKFPIIQHVYFGQLMPFENVSPGTTVMSANLGTLSVSSSRIGRHTNDSEMGPPLTIPPVRSSNITGASVKIDSIASGDETFNKLD